MTRSVVIDCFATSLDHYRDGYAVVAVDVIRATTTAGTAVATGRRCFPVPSLEVAVPLAARLENPLLVGELGGNMPYGFHLQNSPAAIARQDDLSRPMILLSTSGTGVIYAARGCEAVYAACLRNYTAHARTLAQHHPRVAVVGAGTRGEFREEDQLCCAWIAEQLIEAGYEPRGEQTAEVIQRWRGAPVDAITTSKSARYLRDTGQLGDLEFILTHVDDLDHALVLAEEELVTVPSER
jgi:2-phosphosulfolactate phosphatase